MRVAYKRLTDASGIMSWLAGSGAVSIVVDVEPLVAFWDTDDQALVRGVCGFRGRVADQAPGVRVVCFATNSRRRLSVALDGAPLVRYVAAAGKPLRVAAYRDLPRPGVVIGDQVATDGMLAWRLGFAFLHLRLPLDRVPGGPQLMNHLGRPLRPLLFRPRS